MILEAGQQSLSYDKQLLPVKNLKMFTRSYIALIVVSIFWGFVGVVCPILVQFFMGRSPNKGIVQIMFVLTAVSCYVFWLCAYLFQLNPLIGPQLESNLIRIMQYEWGGIDPYHHKVEAK